VPGPTARPGTDQDTRPTKGGVEPTEPSLDGPHLAGEDQPYEDIFGEATGVAFEDILR
jgi:hypothetical protein